VNQRFTITGVTVLMLVLLRLNIGWHFFSEGVKHSLDPHWTSEAVLRAAKGPLAPMYQMYLPDFHHLEELLHRDSSQTEDHAIQAWSDEIQADWEAQRLKFADYYQLDEPQQQQAAKTQMLQRDRLKNWMALNHDALLTHIHEWRRREATRETPAGALPYQKKRLADKEAQLRSEAASWRVELAGLEDDYHTALDKLLSDAQREKRPLRHPTTEIDLIDALMSYVILTIGVLLLVGLFTRTACVAGAAFLFSVVMMQPFWVSETAPTFNQYVEMFALLMLATTAVGRWAGLDFFVHGLVRGWWHEKGKSDVPTS
jgi:hypothetical protein